MRLLHENETVTEELRLERKREMLRMARDALDLILATMPELELTVRSPENEQHRKETHRRREREIGKRSRIEAP